MVMASVRFITSILRPPLKTVSSTNFLVYEHGISITVMMLKVLQHRYLRLQHNYTLLQHGQLCC
jgi:low affinity Fe/Cu permease